MVIINDKSVRELKATKYIDGVEVAHAMLILHTRPNGKKIGLIEDVWTHEKHRKKGIASEMMASLIEVAKEEGVYKIVLACAEHNIPLYQKLGFKLHENSMRLTIE